MPEETFETPQPQPEAGRPLDDGRNWPKIILATVLGLGLLAGSAYAGYYYGTQRVQQSGRPTEDSTFQIEIDTMIGGGVVGATYAYLINSAGEVYEISSPTWGVSSKRELVKRINQEVVRSLMDSLIKANIFEVEEGAPAYSGKSWHVVIGGQEKTIYFVETPNNLLETEELLEEILRLER